MNTSLKNASSIENTHPEVVHPSSTPPTTPPENMKQSGFISEIFKFSVIALLIVVPFRMFVAQPFIVSGSSMDPTFSTGQYLIVDQLTYQFEEPVRGDVIVFHFPEDPSKFFIKRIIGLPGDTVAISESAVSITNTHDEVFTLTEPYINRDTTKADHLTVPLDTDEFFVMGDNRAASSDSRVWGPVPRKNIVGKAFVRLLPLSAIAVFPGQYHHTSTLSESSPSTTPPKEEE